MINFNQVHPGDVISLPNKSGELLGLPPFMLTEHGMKFARHAADIIQPGRSPDNMATGLALDALIGHIYNAVYISGPEAGKQTCINDADQVKLVRAKPA